MDDITWKEWGILVAAGGVGSGVRRSDLVYGLYANLVYAYAYAMGGSPDTDILHLGLTLTGSGVLSVVGASYLITKTLKGVIDRYDPQGIHESRFDEYKRLHEAAEKGDSFMAEHYKGYFIRKAVKQINGDTP